MHELNLIGYFLGETLVGSSTVPHLLMTLEGPSELFQFTVVLQDELLLLFVLWGVVYIWAVECEVLLGVAAKAMEV